MDVPELPARRLKRARPAGGWMRCALPSLPALLASSASAACLLSAPPDKDAQIDEAFQHVTPGSDGYFELHWNSSGDSALAVEHVPRILAALQAARAHYLSLPGAWDAPLGPRARYPVLVVRQDTPGATTLPFEQDGTSGLSWIQLDHQPERWGGDPGELLDVTCAHEFFHALQFAWGADLRNLAFYESSAVWAEDQVFPDHDDWAARYLPALLTDLQRPLTYTGGLREYGAGAVLKFLLAEEADWSPCRAALQFGALTGDCWPRLLDSLQAPPADELAACLTELLRAGDAERAWRVPELAGQPAPMRSTFPGLTRAGGIPAEAQELEGLAWEALALGDAGRLQAAGLGLYHLAETAEQPVAWADSARLAVSDQDWLLLVNAGTQPRAGLGWLAWSNAATPLRVWPNPGGSRRQLEFAAASYPLEIRNLLGQRLALWTPPGPGPGPWALVLPPAANGPLLLGDPARGAAVMLTVLR